MFIARTAIALFVAAQATVPALASEPVKPTPQESPAPAAKEKKFCAALATTGSRLKSKVCKTRDQWMTEDNFDPLAAK